MNIINLTKHAVNIYNLDRELILTIEPSGQEARIPVERRVIGSFLGVSLFETIITGKPTGLPDPRPERIYIVSGTFRQSYDRPDLYQPGELLRNEQGQPIGCIGLSR